ncbi:unnamed protein product [Cuscuta europaea]|uniref:Uncharacterized protein n=1 Tax=Cuscuta europaea TaxID=41803 RepID=A0A9P0ZNW6_CUSEU|nr:unnamed protein product [Cuscuta europaea]
MGDLDVIHDSREILDYTTGGVTLASTHFGRRQPEAKGCTPFDNRRWDYRHNFSWQGEHTPWRREGCKAMLGSGEQRQSTRIFRGADIERRHWPTRKSTFRARQTDWSFRPKADWNIRTDVRPRRTDQHYCRSYLRPGESTDRRQTDIKHPTEDEFDIDIESKCFNFKVMDCTTVRISEMKNGLSSVVTLDIAGVNWLKDSILEVFSGNSLGTKLELNKSLIVLYDANLFGGFIRIIEKGCDSLFIPEGRNGQGINLFLMEITKARALMKQRDILKDFEQEQLKKPTEDLGAICKDSMESLVGDNVSISSLLFNEDLLNFGVNSASKDVVLLQENAQGITTANKEIATQGESIIEISPLQVSFPSKHIIKGGLDYPRSVSSGLELPGDEFVATSAQRSLSDQDLLDHLVDTEWCATSSRFLPRRSARIKAKSWLNNRAVFLGLFIMADEGY